MDLTPQTNAYCNLEKIEGARQSPLSGMSCYAAFGQCIHEGEELLGLFWDKEKAWGRCNDERERNARYEYLTRVDEINIA